MAAEKEKDDPYAKTIKLFHPTAPKVAKFPDCSLAREYEDTLHSIPDQVSSSPDPTPSEPAGIVMISLPDSPNSVEQQVEDNAVFHEPLEHYSYLPFSEDQNPDELCAEGARTVNLGDGSGRLKKVRVLDGLLENGTESKKSRVRGKEFNGRKVPVGESERVVFESQGNEGVNDTEIIVLDSEGSSEETSTVNLAEDSLDKVNATMADDGTIDGAKRTGILMNGIDENLERERECQPSGCEGGSKDKKPCVIRGLRGSMDNGKIEDGTVELKCNVGNGYVEMRQERCVVGFERVAVVEEDAKQMSKVSKRIEDIDNFTFAGWDDVGRRWNGRTSSALGATTRKRLLPLSMKEKKQKHEEGGNGVESVEGKSGLLDILDVIKVVARGLEYGYEDVDFLETAKRRGLTLPRARWWPSEDDGE